MNTTAETSGLIAASKVNGTPVYNADGEQIGKIFDLLLDKNDGNVAYALISFGGFLGMRNSYHPIPWPVLRYDTRVGGYGVNLSNEQLEAAPSFTTENAPNWNDRAYDKRVYNYYNTNRYWS